LKGLKSGGEAMEGGGVFWWGMPFDYGIAVYLHAQRGDFVVVYKRKSRIFNKPEDEAC